MNVVIYARFSSTKQNETSIEAQLKACYEFCRNNNYVVIEEYIDEAKSAKTDNRPEFRRMIEDSNKKEFEGIVVYQLDRFARNRYDSAMNKAKLKKNGVRVYSAKERITNDASGIVMEGILETFAEYYSAELSEKVKRNLMLNAEKGLFNGGYAPLGYKVVDVDFGAYKKKKLEIDTNSSQIVKEIFEMRANGTNIMDIVNYLNEKGYKTIQGKEFKKTSLQQILKNKRYIGTNIYNDMEFENTIPAIIDKELFNNVQEIIKKNKYAPARAKAKEEYILTTKLFCGHCKEAMTGTCGTSQTGKIYYYYTCNGVKKKICNRKKVQKHYIEDIVVNKCRDLLTDKNINMIAKKVYEICKKENAQNCLLRELEKQEKKLQKNINNLITALEGGENIDIINNRLTQNRQELKKVREQLYVEQGKLANLTEAGITFFLIQLKNGNINDIKYRKTLINIFINKIYLYDNKITIIFNIGKNKVTVNDILLNEIEANFKKTNSLCLNKLGQPSFKLRVARDCGLFIFFVKVDFRLFWGQLGDTSYFK